MALVFFEDADTGMVRRVDRGLVGMRPELLTLTELLQTLGGRRGAGEARLNSRR